MSSKLYRRDCETCHGPVISTAPRARFCSCKCAGSAYKRPNVKEQVWWLSANGYIEGYVYENGIRRRIKQHRYLIEQQLGRRLEAHEEIHHLNGVKTDNRIENLQVLTHSEHQRITNAGRPYKRGYRVNLSPEGRARKTEATKAYFARKRAERAVANA